MQPVVTRPRKVREEPSHTYTMKDGGILPLGSRLQTLTSDRLSQPGEKPEPQNQSVVRGLCSKCAQVRGGTELPHPDPQHTDVTTMTLPPLLMCSTCSDGTVIVEIGPN